MPYGEVLHRWHPRLKKLEFLLELYPPPTSGKLDSIVEDSREGLPLQSPARQETRFQALIRAPGLRSKVYSYTDPVSSYTISVPMLKEGHV